MNNNSVLICLEGITLQLQNLLQSLRFLGVGRSGVGEFHSYFHSSQRSAVSKNIFVLTLSSISFLLSESKKQ